jgi:transcriptional regulator with GAF, ATPase, and Fis domain
MQVNTHPLDARAASVHSGPAPLVLHPRPDAAEPEVIVGQSDGLRYVMSRVDLVAETDATVLLCGETGTGKGLIASAIHRASRRRDKPYVVVNCATLPASLIESELFGRERGAFTGAHATQAGRFELAHRGTVFLDEIGELPLELQPKLLRVIQTGQLEHLGSPRTIEVDVRIIAATNRDLLDEVNQGRFRRDLYYRLNVFPITVPSLRDRREDIGLLVRHLVEKHSRLLRKRVESVPDGVIRALESYEWPGNIRELENVIQRAIILTPGRTLELKDAWLPPTEAAPAEAATTLVEVERRHILHILDACRWRIEGAGGAAQLLAMKSSTLRSRMVKLGIARPK